MQNNIRKSAAQFVQKYELSKNTLTVTRLRGIIESLDFCIVDYWNNVENEPDTIRLFMETNTMQFHKYVKAYTYYTPEKKLVFLCGDLSADDTIDVLLHELGHIYLNHQDPEGLITNTSVQREREAFQFSQYVQDRCRKSGQAKRIKPVCIIGAAVLIIFATGLILHSLIPGKTVTRDGQTIIRVGGLGMDAYLQPHCYWTQGGEVFHLWSDCQHISKSATIYVGTVEKSQKNACCKTCYKKFCERYGNGTE